MLSAQHKYSDSYEGQNLNRVAFPIGGIGAGMVCFEGSGALSHVSVRHHPDVFHEPQTFAAICVKQNSGNIARVLEGPVPSWKYFGQPHAGNGASGATYGLPRFTKASFKTRFPFADILLTDEKIPLDVQLTGWSPFIPNDADNSSLPAGALEYQFTNPTDQAVEAVFSFHSHNLMRIKLLSEWNNRFADGWSIKPFSGGFLLWQDAVDEHPEYEGGFAFFTDAEDVVVDHCWFRGGWFDPITVVWKTIQDGEVRKTPSQDGNMPGASLYVPIQLQPGKQKTVRVMMTWYVPISSLNIGDDPKNGDACCADATYVPWYAGRYKTIYEVAEYWRSNYKKLWDRSQHFSEAFYRSTLPPEVLDAVAANLTILKSPTVLRQKDGRLWAFEGCHDNSGCCSGSCTHVWNYAQAIPHLFPSLERTLRETEFFVSQDKRGHQNFRSNLPIRLTTHTFHAASDGQLGGIIKVYREWRISGDTEWLRSLWPAMRQSLDYCIHTWDPRERGWLEEPHHNTYDIEYWGPNGHCTSFYLGALQAAVEMGDVLNDDIKRYRKLLKSGRKRMETELFNGDYFIQKVQWEGLNAPDPIKASAGQWNVNYSPEAKFVLEKEGPKYQYGTGCLSDGVLGIWLAEASGLDQEIVDRNKVKKHLLSVHKYNLRFSLAEHVNPQRPSYALGKDGGLLICTWPKGDMPTLPFVYSNEVWTGIEYQVASHLMMMGEVEKGLEIVRLCRDRYDGSVRNPFNEYECGHWYARAMASYGLLQGLTGIRYDAVEKTLYIDSQVGDEFVSFLATNTGFGNVGLKKGKPFIDWVEGELDVQRVLVSNNEAAFDSR